MTEQINFPPIAFPLGRKRAKIVSTLCYEGSGLDKWCTEVSACLLAFFSPLLMALIVLPLEVLA